MLMIHFEVLGNHLKRVAYGGKPVVYGSKSILFLIMNCNGKMDTALKSKRYLPSSFTCTSRRSFFSAMLDGDGTLRWSDGETWVRAQESQTFTVSIYQLSGARVVLVNNLPDDSLASLHWKVSQQLNIPADAVQLLQEGIIFDPNDDVSTLSSLRISQGSELTLIRLPLLALEHNMRINVENSGTGEVNGIYQWSEQGFFQKVDGNQAIVWKLWDWQEPDGWSLQIGWHLQSSGMTQYFVESNGESIPTTGWSSYKAEGFSIPGVEPMPQITKL
mmetsp:Transcript_37410/g.64915  ORF Transcript_37410/g.64915 Transcript_37410/m.64915 type:complete len:274 (-) Transcript_37410:189-1010(-)